MAVAFTEYDSETEPILDETIGKVVFVSYSWGEHANGTVWREIKEIPSHTCSPAELGVF